MLLKGSDASKASEGCWGSKLNFGGLNMVQTCFCMRANVPAGSRQCWHIQWELPWPVLLFRRAGRGSLGVGDSHTDGLAQSGSKISHKTFVSPFSK